MASAHRPEAAILIARSADTEGLFGSAFLVCADVGRKESTSKEDTAVSLLHQVTTKIIEWEQREKQARWAQEPYPVQAERAITHALRR
jgi:hypothetical protein